MEHVANEGSVAFQKTSEARRSDGWRLTDLKKGKIRKRNQETSRNGVISRAIRTLPE
jgi:hypothetical protein